MKHSPLSFITFISSCLLLLLSSCGNSLPSEQLALKKLNSKPNSPFEYVDFKKTNGIKGNQMGQKMYEMKFHARLVAKETVHLFAQPKDTLCG